MRVAKKNVRTSPPLTRKRLLAQLRNFQATTHNDSERNKGLLGNENPRKPINVFRRNVTAPSSERTSANVINEERNPNVSKTNQSRLNKPLNTEPNDERLSNVSAQHHELNVSRTIVLRHDNVLSDERRNDNNEQFRQTNDMAGEENTGPPVAPTITMSYTDLQQTIIAANQATLAAPNQVNPPNPPLVNNGNGGPNPVTHHHYGEAAKLIPVFDPIVYPHQTITQWLKKVDEVAAIYHWTEHATIHHAMLQLQGTARMWYEGLSSIRHTWDEWKAQLKEWFPAPRGSQRSYREMEQRTRQKDEPIDLYYYDKVSKARACGLTDEALMEFVITGLNDDRLVTALSTREYSSPPELLKFMRQMEERLRTTKDSRERARNTKILTEQKTNGTEKPGYSKKGFNGSNETKSYDNGTKYKSQPKTNAAGEVLCFNCNKYGHISRMCPLPPRRTRCTYCQRTSHESKDCPTKVQGTPSTSKQVLITQNKLADTNSNEKYYKEATFNGVKVKSYIDLGSRCVTLAESAAHEMHLVYQPPPQGCVIGGYGAGETLPIGRLDAEITVDAATATTEVYVVPDSAQAIPLLIGHPFTEQKHVTIVRRNQTLRLFNEQHDDEDNCLKKIEVPDLPPPRVNLWAKSATIIPPNYIGFVDIYTKDCQNTHHDLFIEAQIRPHLGQEHCIPRSIVSLDEKGHSQVPVANVSEHEIRFKANQKVTKAEFCHATEPTQESQTLIMTTEVREKSPIPIESINAGPTVTKPELENLHQLINEYRDCFAETINELGRTNKAKMTIDLSTTQPITFRPYRLSLAERERVRNKLDELKQAGIVVDSTSPYASPILVVRKKSGEERICVDYRALNRITKRDIFPLPLIDDQLERLQGNKLFTSLDLASGYYQIPMDNESQHKTAFVTPDGHYEFTSLPFGLTNGPAVFQRMIHAVLGPLRYTIALAYMDDILVPSVSVTEGLEHLRQILEVLRQGNLTLNLKKCAFLQTQVEYLGYEINEHGLQPNERKINCVRDFPAPVNVHELRRFLGLASYFRRFVERFAVIASPLHALLRKDVSWKWGHEEQTSFQSLKTKLTERPTLGLYDQKAPTELHTDACQRGLAAILMQKGGDDKLHPISYASRATTSDEQKYHSYELETLAVVWSVDKYRPYLLGRQFTIVTDCNSMRNTLAKKDLVPRIGRWILTLQEYTYDVEHRPGTKMAHVDSLSRAPVGNSEETETINGLQIFTTEISFRDWMITAQMQDEKLQEIQRQLQKTEQLTKDDKRVKEEFELIDGRIFKRLRTGDTNDIKLAWVCPTRSRWQVVKQSHDDIGHYAVEKTLSRVQATYWFPRMRRYIRRYISSCLECLYRKQPTGKPQGFLHSIDKSGGPFHTLHMDHLGPFVTSTQGNAYLIVAVDACTKFSLLRAVRNTGMKPAAQFLDHIIGIFGAPARVITDQGTTYTGHAFESACKRSKILHIKNATATPRGNGQVERYNRTLTPAIASLCERPDEKDWDRNLKQIQWGLNNTIHSATKKTPFFLLFNYHSRSPTGDFIEPQVQQVVNEAIAQRRKEAIENLKRDQDQQRKRYNRKRVKPTNYEPGDLVVLRKDPVATGEPRKTAAKYRGPYIVTKRLKGDRFQIEDVPEIQRYILQQCSSCRYKLKRWIVVNNEDESNEDDSYDTDDSRDQPERTDPDNSIDQSERSDADQRNSTSPDTPTTVSDRQAATGQTPVLVNPDVEISPQRVNTARPQRIRAVPKYLSDYRC